MPDATKFKYLVHVSYVLTTGTPAPKLAPGTEALVFNEISIDELRKLGNQLSEYTHEMEYHPDSFVEDAVENFGNRVNDAKCGPIIGVRNYGSRPVDKTWTSALGETWACPVDDQERVCIGRDAATGLCWQLAFEMDWVEAELA